MTIYFITRLHSYIVNEFSLTKATKVTHSTSKTYWWVACIKKFGQEINFRNNSKDKWMMNVQCLIRISHVNAEWLCLVMNIRLMHLAALFDFSNTKRNSESYWIINCMIMPIIHQLNQKRLICENTLNILTYNPYSSLSCRCLPEVIDKI